MPLPALPSMGPQLVRCGMYAHHTVLRVLHNPSMGPQLVRCGMFAFVPLRPKWQSPFNGAATCSLRNVDSDEVRFSLLMVPSMGPQLVRCGMLLLTADDLMHFRPSMGPQLVRCGMFTCDGCHKLIIRTFNGAATCSLRNEIVRYVSASADVLPFNGAATCSLRNARSAARAAPRTGCPSMGPQLVRCGMIRYHYTPYIVPAPSMGPQLVRCGMRDQHEYRDDDHPPSMGPQLVRCGMLPCR